jgi:glycogen debranching enzyme
MVASTLPVTEPTITLVEGTCFAISSTTGEIVPGGMNGLFFQDTRMLSAWRLLIDGSAPQPLSAHLDTPFQATFLGRHRGAGASLFVQRRRLVGQGMREDIVLRNLGADDTSCRLAIEVETDLAGRFEIGSANPRVGDVSFKSDGEDLLAEESSDGRQRGVRIRLEGSTKGSTVAVAGMLAVDIVIPAGDEWCGTVQVFPILDHEEFESAYATEEPLHESPPVRRLRDWQHASPTIDLHSESFAAVIDRSIQDLGALRIRATDTEGVEREAVAAGAPWFMTLFGRDSLLTAWMALPISQELAMSTLHALAALQGSEVNPLNEEEPGRILHEMRHGPFPLSPRHPVYYGTADATPLFCMLVGELHRWGMPKERLAPLMPHVDRALAWILEYGDRDGDGFVEYKRANDTGLVNQGWKDVEGSISFADGRLAEAPIAMSEVQAYVYGAFVARAELARTFGEDPTGWESRAAELRHRFQEAFWLPEQGYYAMALDGDKRPVDALGSNVGHVLWTGLADPDSARQIADRLVSPEMFSGWGIRTLATTMARYDPVEYHNGAVWPHDTTICVAGLARYGFTEQAVRVARGVLDAAVLQGGRLPELFCGFDRSEFPYPVAYPTSCSPQAWAAASPLLLIRAILGLEPDIPAGKVYLDPPAESLEAAGITIRNMPLAKRRIDVDGRGRGAIHRLPGIEVVRRRRSA